MVHASVARQDSTPVEDHAWTVRQDSTVLVFQPRAQRVSLEGTALVPVRRPTTTCAPLDLMARKVAKRALLVTESVQLDSTVSLDLPAALTVQQARWPLRRPGFPRATSVWPELRATRVRQEEDQS